MLDITGLDATLDTLVHIAQIVGIPIAIVLFFFTKRRERKDRERGTYDSLDEKYQNYLFVALKNPDLPLVAGDQPQFLNPILDEPARYRLDCGYLILTSILERAYLLYYDGRRKPSNLKEWNGWNGYMYMYLKFPPYRQFWNTIENEEDSFHEDFMSYMKSIRIQIDNHGTIVKQPSKGEP